MAFRPLLRGTLVLTAAGLFSRFTGSIYRILLVRVIGETGIGLFQMAFPAYALAATAGTLGLPAALAKVVSERAARDDWPGVVQARTVAAVLTAAATLVSVCLAWAGTGFMSHTVLTDPRTEPSLVVMPLAVAVASFAAVLRGYFHGLQDLVPGAVAQTVEQAVRIPIVLLLAWLLVPYGLGAAAAGAMFGVAVGEVAGLICLLLWYYRQETVPRPWRRPPRGTPAPGFRQTARYLLALGLPAMLGDMMGALTATADAVIIPRRLQQAGLGWDQATALYGGLTGMVLPVLWLPMVLTYPLGAALMPSVSAAHALGQRRLLVRRILLGTRLTLAIAAASALLFYTAPGYIARILYGNTDVAPLISLLAVAAPFVYLQSTQNAILLGLGLNGASLRNYLVGVTVRIATIYVLTGNPSLGVSGALWGIVAGQVVMGTLHALSIRRAIGRFPLP